MAERVELNQAMMVYVDPRAKAWCRQLSSGLPKPELGITAIRVIDRGFRAFNGNGVHPLVGEQPSVVLKPIAISVPPKLQEELRGATRSLGLHPDNIKDIKRVVAHLVLAAYLQAHPREPAVLPTSPSVTIFRQPTPPPEPCGYIPNPKDREAALFGGEKKEEPEEQHVEHQESPAARRVRFRRVIAEIMGEDATRADPIVIFGQTDSSSDGVTANVTCSQSSPINNGRFSAKKVAYPFKIDPEELKQLAKQPTFSSDEIRDHRKALGVSQGVLAASLNMRRGYVTDAEGGRRAQAVTRENLTIGIRYLEAHPEHIKWNPIKNPAQAGRILK